MRGICFNSLSSISLSCHFLFSRSHPAILFILFAFSPFPSYLLICIFITFFSLFSTLFSPLLPPSYFHFSLSTSHFFSSCSTYLRSTLRLSGLCATINNATKPRLFGAHFKVFVFALTLEIRALFRGKPVITCYCWSYSTIGTTYLELTFGAFLIWCIF